MPSTEKQTEIIDQVVKYAKTAILAKKNPTANNPVQFCFVSGAGGVGKTVVAAKIAAQVRANGGLVVGCAATALAATIYKDNFYTAHSLFKYPVDEDEADEGKNISRIPFLYSY
jgi:pantothenate kinase-related protein Tda10